MPTDDTSPATKADISTVLKKLVEHDHRFDQHDDRFTRLEKSMVAKDDLTNAARLLQDQIDLLYDYLQENVFSAIKAQGSAHDERLTRLEQRAGLPPR